MKYKYNNITSKRKLMFMYIVYQFIVNIINNQSLIEVSYGAGTLGVLHFQVAAYYVLVHKCSLLRKINVHYQHC